MKRKRGKTSLKHALSEVPSLSSGEVEGLKARSSKLKGGRHPFSFHLSAFSLQIIVSLLLCFFAQSTSLAASKRINEKLLQLQAHKGPFTFVVLGDNRSGDRIYQQLVRLSLSRKPDFFVNTGDVIVHPGSREQWKNFWRISSAIDLPNFLAIGNHDVDDKKSEAVWKDEVDLPGNELYYSWVVGRSLFVVLDGYETDRENKIEGAQFDWLKKTLDPNKYEHQFVFLHPPLFLRKGAEHYGDSLDRHPELRDKLQALFVQKKVDAVFMGHEHEYEKRKVDGVWHIITGGGGAPIYGESFCHFVFVSVDGPRAEAKIIDKEGVIHDEFNIH